MANLKEQTGKIIKYRLKLYTVILFYYHWQNDNLLDHMACSMCLLRISMHFLTRWPKCSMTRRHWSCGMSCTASPIAAFSSYMFWRSLPQSLSLKNPNKWKSRGLKSGLFALHGWRVLWLMHLVSKWFEIHCSTSLDTWGATPSCWNHWRRRRSLTPVTCRSCL